MLYEIHSTVLLFMPLLLVQRKYTFTKYSQSLNRVIEEMKNWGIQHRRRIMKKEKK